jgi:hypothetical protein
MLQPCFLALCTLAIALYLQARLAAREIRRNREGCDNRAICDLTL